MLEASCHEASSFVTLTYSDENLPSDNSVDSRHIQLFMKRLRKAYNRPIRYYAVGEYGEENLRPHYHLALFGFGPDGLCRLHNHGAKYDSDPLIDSVWGLGKTDVKPLVLETAAYVCGYVTKKLDVPDKRLMGRLPEFARMSRRPGIGAPAMASIADALQSPEGWDVIDRTGDVPRILLHGGKSWPLGPFLTRLLRKEMNFENIGSQKEASIQQSEELLSVFLDYVAAQAEEEKPTVTLKQMYMSQNRQRFRNEEAKYKLFRRQRNL